MKDHRPLVLKPVCPVCAARLRRCKTGGPECLHCDGCGGEFRGVRQ